MTEMVSSTCDTHADRHDCPDALLGYEPRFDEYGILVHDGGSSSVLIEYCPWCGHVLPDSKRERWFDQLAARGVDPDTDSVPPEFESDAWWRGSMKPAG
jgi:hypothetical protein